MRVSAGADGKQYRLGFRDKRQGNATTGGNTALSKGMFADFYMCPVCKMDTRHYCYTKDNRENMKTRTMRVTFCEKCGMMRFQVKSTLGTWVFGSMTGHTLEVPL